LSGKGDGKPNSTVAPAFALVVEMDCRVKPGNDEIDMPGLDPGIQGHEANRYKFDQWFES